MKKYQGALVALVTPFKDGKVDEQGLVTECASYFASCRIALHELGPWCVQRYCHTLVTRLEAKFAECRYANRARDDRVG